MKNGKFRWNCFDDYPYLGINPKSRKPQIMILFQPHFGPIFIPMIWPSLILLLCGNEWCLFYVRKIFYLHTLIIFLISAISLYIYASTTHSDISSAPYFYLILCLLIIWFSTLWDIFPTFNNLRILQIFAEFPFSNGNSNLIWDNFLLFSNLVHIDRTTWVCCYFCEFFSSKRHHFTFL